jgi:hypothetical protein
MNQPFLPRTAEEMIEFIDVHFECHQFAEEDGTPLPAEMNRFTLTVHDLISAFRWAGWYDDEIVGEMEYASWFPIAALSQVEQGSKTP